MIDLRNWTKQVFTSDPIYDANLVYNLFVVKDRITRDSSENAFQKDQLYDLVVKVDEVVKSEGNWDYFLKEFNLKKSDEELVLLKITDTSNVLLYLVCSQRRVPAEVKIGEVVRVNKVAKSKGLMSSK